MSIAILIEADQATNAQEVYDKVTQELLGGKRDQARPGLISHTAAIDDTGAFVVMDVWADRASMEEWMAQVNPIIEREATGPPPRMRTLEPFNVVIGTQGVTA
jgi:hypothetical protein